MKRRSLLFLLIIITEVLIIAAVGVKIYKRRNNVLGEISVNPIRTENVIIEKGGELNYFYEPQANTAILESKPWLSKEVTYTINKDRLNERFEYSVDEPKETFRIVALGDSFTYGEGVDTKDNYVEQLENFLNQKLECPTVNKFEVLNLGVRGYDIEFSVERFRLRGQKYNPNIVIWFLKDDDFRDIREIMVPIEQKYWDEYYQNPSMEAYQSALGESYKELEGTYDTSSIIDYATRALTKIKAYHSGNLLIFTFPFTDKKYKQIMEKFIGSLNNSYYFEGIPDIYKAGKTLADYHPTKAGHELIANSLLEHLIAEGLIPCY